MNKEEVRIKLSLVINNYSTIKWIRQRVLFKRGYMEKI